MKKVKLFIKEYKWEGINFSLEKDDRKKFLKNSRTILLNVLYGKKEKKYPVYVSKHYSNCEKQVILLITPKGERWDYLAGKKYQHY